MEPLPEQVEKWVPLAQWMTDNHVPGLGPAEGMKLARVVAQLDRAVLNDALPAELTGPVDQYVRALHEVMDVSIAHQRVIIERLTTLLGLPTLPSEPFDLQDTNDYYAAFQDEQSMPGA